MQGVCFCVARAAKVPYLSLNDLICIKTLSFDFRGKGSLPLLLRANGVFIHREMVVLKLVKISYFLFIALHFVVVPISNCRPIVATTRLTLSIH